MIEAEADVALGEAIRPAGEAQRRVYGGGPLNVLICAIVFALFITIGGFGSSALYPALGRTADLLSLLFLMIGGMVAVSLYTRLHMRGFLRALRKLGSPAMSRSHFRFDDDGFAIETGRIFYRLPWSAVLLVASTQTHWLIQVDTTTFAVPKRAFGLPSDEQAFVELARNSISETARAYSAFEDQ